MVLCPRRLGQSRAVDSYAGRGKEKTSGWSRGPSCFRRKPWPVGPAAVEGGRLFLGPRRSLSPRPPAAEAAWLRCQGGAALRSLVVAMLLLVTPACFLHLPFRHHANQGPPAPEASQTQSTGGTSTSKNVAKEEPAEPTENAAAAPTGFIGFEQLQFGHSKLAAIGILDTDVGYAFNDHISADFGLPVILSRSPFSPVSTHDYQWYALFGAPYIDIRYTGVHSGWKYTSVLTGTIPVSNEDQIFETARPGVDLYTHAERGKIGGVTPFINIGLSNGAIDRFVMPRPYTEARPYETLGALADGELGAEYRLDYGPAKGVSVGASYYGLEPVGPQKVFSRIVVPYSALASTVPQFGEHYRYWDTTFETNMPIQVEGAQALTGLASGTYDGCTVTNTVITCKALSSIARDNGYSGWININLPRWSFATLQLGYVHSVHYALNTYTVTLSFDAKKLARTLLSPR